MLGWSEVHMREYFGWDRASPMPSYYSHLAQGDATRFEMQRRGILDPSQEFKPALLGDACPRCRTPNPLGQTFCIKCGAAVSAAAVAEEKAAEEARINDIVAAVVAKHMRDKIAMDTRKVLDPTPA